MVLTSLSDDLINAIIAKYGYLTKLNLCNNGLMTIKNIEKLTSLERLNLSCNAIDDLLPLASLLNLRELDLHENEIMDIQPLGSLLRLETLDLSHNKIGSSTIISPLRNASQLSVLDLRGNPLCVIKAYSKDVLAVLPQLTILDSRNRSEYEPTLVSSAPSYQGEVPTSADKHTSNPSIASGSLVQLTRSPPDALHEHALKDKIEALERQLSAMEAAFSLQEQALSAPVPATAGAIVRRNLNSNNVSTKASHSIMSLDSSVANFPYVKLLTMWRRTALREMVGRRMTDHTLKQHIAEAKAVRTTMSMKLHEAEGLSAGWRQRGVAAQSLVQSLRTELEQSVTARQEADRQSQAALQQAALYRHALWNMRLDLEQCKSRAMSEGVRDGSILLQALKRLEQYEQRVESAAKRITFIAHVLAQKEVSLRNTLAAFEADRRLLQLSVASKSKTRDRSSQESNRHRHRVSTRSRGSGRRGSGEDMEEESDGRSRRVSPMRAHGGTSDADVEESDGNRNGFHNRTHRRGGGDDYDDLFDSEDEDGREYGSDEAGRTTREDEGGDGGLDDAEDLAETSLRPEVEALLRALFRQLDSADSGCVSLTLLLACVAGEEEGGSKAVHDMLLRGLGTNRLKLLARGIRRRLRGRSSSGDLGNVSNRAHDCTWGEFLLFLVPTVTRSIGWRQTGSSSILGKSDLRWLPDDCKKMIFSDVDWAMIPLQIPAQLEPHMHSSMQSNTSSVDPRNSRADMGFGLHEVTALARDEKRGVSGASDAELKRLASERSFLLQRLQRLSHEQLRRDTDTAVRFKHSLRKGQLREERLQAELSASRSAEAALSLRLLERETALEQLRKVSETRDAELNEEIFRLKDTVRELRVREESREGTALAEERERFTRLENEHKLLKREATRSEVRCKALQRDVTRLQHQLEVAQKETSTSPAAVPICTAQVTEPPEHNAPASRGADNDTENKEVAALAERIRQLEQQLLLQSQAQAQTQTQTQSDREEEKVQKDDLKVEAAVKALDVQTVKPPTVALPTDLSSAASPAAQNADSAAILTRLDRLSRLAHRLLEQD